MGRRGARRIGAGARGAPRAEILSAEVGVPFAFRPPNLVPVAAGMRSVPDRAKAVEGWRGSRLGSLGFLRLVLHRELLELGSQGLPRDPEELRGPRLVALADAQRVLD